MALRAADDRCSRATEQAAQSICPAIRLAHRRAGNPFHVSDIMRIAVFIDYQNVYHAARRAFHDRNAPPSSGQISPRKLAELLRLRQNGGDGFAQPDFDQVRVYRGLPRPNDRGYGPARRQIAAWRADGVTVVTRPLSGPPSAPREKGIDISLALDFFEGASTGAFDLGILCSVDSDFEPLIERVLDPDRSFAVAVETAAWWAPPRQVLQLGGGSGVRCHLLTEADYDMVRDRTHYGIPARSRRRRRRNRG